MCLKILTFCIIITFGVRGGRGWGVWRGGGAHGAVQRAVQALDVSQLAQHEPHVRVAQCAYAAEPLVSALWPLCFIKVYSVTKTLELHLPEIFFLTNFQSTAKNMQGYFHPCKAMIGNYIV